MFLLDDDRVDDDWVDERVDNGVIEWVIDVDIDDRETRRETSRYIYFPNPRHSPWEESYDELDRKARDGKDLVSHRLTCFAHMQISTSYQAHIVTLNGGLNT